MANLLPSPKDPLVWTKGFAEFKKLLDVDGHSIEEPHKCSWCANIRILEESPDGGTFASNPLLQPKHILEAAQTGCMFYKWAAACLYHIISNRKAQIKGNETLFLTLNPEADDFGVNFQASLRSESGSSKMELPRIHAWTYETGDKAASFLSRRPPEIKADEKTLEFGRSCLRNCLASHVRCRPGFVEKIPRSLTIMKTLSPKDAPSRLLHIQEKGGELHARLVDLVQLDSEESEHLMQNGYFTLSYCWGKDQPVQLTFANESRLRNGIPSIKLPKTLSDALWVSHSLGYYFIWIDALCIFQDSSSDKAVEIAQMARYYSKSTLTICAASAASCNDGLFEKQGSPPCQFHFGPIELEFKSKSGQLGHIYLAGELVPMQEPLTIRAWTFQETMLSPRMLIFGTHELYWSCKAEHGSHFDGLYDRIYGGDDNLIPGIDSLEPLRFMSPKHQWTSIVSQYSSRLLGFPADRLPAVSALASVLQDGDDTPYNYKDCEPMVYVAGLFITPHDCQSWAEALLWRVTAMISSTRSQPYIAPSWSWASVDGKVYCRRPRQTDRANDFAVEAYGVTLNNKAAPYGMVDDAFLSIRARCRALRGPIPMEMAIALENDHDHLAKEYEPCISNPSLGFVVFYPDTLESRSLIEEAISGKGAVLLVEVFKLPPSGLVMYPVNSQNGPQSITYQRIGCFLSQSTDVNWTSENMNWGDMEAVFAGAQVQSVRVV